MRAVVVTPGAADSDRLEEVPEPRPAHGEALVEVLSVGVDGTDSEIVSGLYGEAPPGNDYLILGHESLGRVVRAAGGLRDGELVAAIVRRPDPVPCVNCANDEWDMCLNGLYTERGIKGRHGFLADLSAEEPKYLVPVPEALHPVGALVEPTSIVEKAVEQAWRIRERLVWEPRRALVTGAGPVGQLAAALLRLRGLDVCVYDRATSGPKIPLVERIGATYLQADEHDLGHSLQDELDGVDVAVEATGYSPLAFDLIGTVVRNVVVVLTGVSAGSRALQVASDHLNLEMVLENKVVVGTVNANRRHFERAVADLARAEQEWPGFLEAMITRREPLERYREALERGPEDVKVLVDVRVV